VRTRGLAAILVIGWGVLSLLIRVSASCRAWNSPPSLTTEPNRRFQLPGTQKLVDASRLYCFRNAMESLPSPSDSVSSRPLSLHQILTLYSRERLLVHPLRWTSRHLELLQCSFGQPTRKATRHEPPYKCAKQARDLASAYGLGFRRGCAERLTSDENGPLVRVKSVVQQPLLLPKVLTQNLRC
jgi:hypothetical protein